jgi:branched-subunit amino acid transport protein AzlD
MEEFIKYIPFIIPLLIIELGLVIFCLVDIAKKKKTKNLSPLIGIIISVVFMSTFIGPVLYIVFGRADVAVSDDNDDI